MLETTTYLRDSLQLITREIVELRALHQDLLDRAAVFEKARIVTDTELGCFEAQLSMGDDSHISDRCLVDKGTTDFDRGTHRERKTEDEEAAPEQGFGPMRTAA